MPDPVKTEEKKAERLPITRGGAQFWQCPACGRDNGIPERRSCRCGAKLNDDGTVSK